MVHLLDEIKKQVQDLEDKQCSDDRLETFLSFKGVIGIVFWVYNLVNK
jgi:hypothetical protein